jgi:hypothetical protein
VEPLCSSGVEPFCYLYLDAFEMALELVVSASFLEAPWASSQILVTMNPHHRASALPMTVVGVLELLVQMPKQEVDAKEPWAQPS